MQFSATLQVDEVPNVIVFACATFKNEIGQGSSRGSILPC